MCLIIAKKPSGQVMKRELRQAFQFNDDGAGFMYVREGTLIVDKGYFGFRKFYKRFRAAERENPTSPFVIHFRLATHGQKDAANCHPYLVNRHIGFAHNGVMSQLGNTVISDSADLAWNHLSKLPADFIHRPEIWEHVETLARVSGSKFAFLDDAGQLKIAQEKDGHWCNDAWYSNSSYKYGRFSYGNWDNDRCDWREWYGYNQVDEWEDCSSCGNYFKNSDMKKIGVNSYCKQCWGAIEDYMTIQCNCCGANTRVGPYRECSTCKNYITDDNILDQLSDKVWC